MENEFQYNLEETMTKAFSRALNRVFRGYDDPGFGYQDLFQILEEVKQNQNTLQYGLADMINKLSILVDQLEDNKNKE